MIRQKSSLKQQNAIASKRMLFQILFAKGDDVLSELDWRRINTLANYLNKNVKAMICVHGHTDVKGTDEYNNVLSQERAKAVKTALTSLGVSNSRITAKGHGSAFTNPNKQENSPRHQRRVDISIKERL